MLRGRNARRVAETLMLRKGSGRCKALLAFCALHLRAAAHVHPPVTAEIGELRVRLETNLALVRLYRAMGVRVLLES